MPSRAVESNEEQRLNDTYAYTLFCVLWEANVDSWKSGFWVWTRCDCYKLGQISTQYKVPFKEYSTNSMQYAEEVLKLIWIHET